VADTAYGNGVKALAALELERLESSNDVAARLQSAIEMDDEKEASVDVLRSRVRDADALSDRSPLASTNRAQSRLNLGRALVQRGDYNEGLEILAEAKEQAQEPWATWILRHAEDTIINALLIPRRGRVSKGNTRQAIQLLRTSAARIRQEPLGGRQSPAMASFWRILLAEMLVANEKSATELAATCEVVAEAALDALRSTCEEVTASIALKWGTHADTLELLLSFELLQFVSEASAEQAMQSVADCLPSGPELQGLQTSYWLERYRALLLLRELIVGSEQASLPLLEVLSIWPYRAAPAIIVAAKLGFAIDRNGATCSALMGQASWRREWDASWAQYYIANALGANAHIAAKVQALIDPTPKSARTKLAIEPTVLDRLEQLALEHMRTGQALREEDLARLNLLWNVLGSGLI
jgi:tetratricopeptide (TPR) repeat protein